MNILGISALYHDSAACLIQDGKIIAAASEERFTRKKQDSSFPLKAIEYCLREGGIANEDLDYVGFYDKPFIKFERILYTYLATFPKSFPSFMKAIPLWLREKLWIPSTINKSLDGFKGEILFAEHHESHAASAFLVSPFEEAALMTVDGVGEWATATLGVGRGNKLEVNREIRFPHSLGLLYSAFTYYLGFKVNSAEYKVMGLAPYGEPKYMKEMEELIDIKEDGSFKMNMHYFAYDYGLTMTNNNFSKLFGAPPRSPESKLTQRDMDLAATVQKITEIIVLKMANWLYNETRLPNLCMAGGVALNCVANGRILRETPFKDIFIQPAAGDAGGALGVAALIWHSILDNPRTQPLQHSFLGPGYSNAEIRSYLQENDIQFQELDRATLLDRSAQLIEEQHVLGWFQGRMEFGPRALGNRSILADARNPANKDIVNMKIKFRESFRPFAPSVLEERVADWFELDKPSPYMLLVAQVREDRRQIPSVTHVDGSARIQTVHRDANPMYYDLIKKFEERTGCPVIINTSFNVRGEPIVCTPHDAYMCFMRTNMDYLVMDHFLMDKRQMKPLADDVDWRNQFELD